MVPAAGPREEFSTLGGGGWRLVSPQISGGGYLTLGDVAGMDQPMKNGGKSGGKQERTRAKMMRRRTTMDRAGAFFVAFRSFFKAPDVLLLSGLQTLLRILMRFTKPARTSRLLQRI